MGYGPSPDTHEVEPNISHEMMPGAENAQWFQCANGGGSSRQSFLGDLTVMNDSFIYEAFGGDSSNDVYNLLTNQFSY
ncbi:hypothetical protein BX600DRAFT_474485 [Xylariales sp. PMI_506]|nr:hypothetical protein BX600DRAFT_474485 [Xylariales sp. PMI_506]